jgi:hypothetical protein
MTSSCAFATKSLCSAALVLGFFGGVWGTAQAQSSPDDAHVHYTVKPGDKLSVLAHRYLQDPAALQAVTSLNRISNIHRIPVGRVIRFPRELLKYTPVSAQVSHLRCTQVMRLDGAQAQEIKLGSTLHEGDILRIPPGCQFAMTLPDQATVRLLSGAVVRLKTLRTNVFDPSPEVHIELLDGRAFVNVPQQRRLGDAPFQVLTPTSVAGIRGTRFRVGFSAQQRSSHVEVQSGLVGARGLAESTERRVNRDHGVAILPDGKSLDIEALIPAPRFGGLSAESGADRVTLRFEAPAQARQFWLTTADDANFNQTLNEGLTDKPQVQVATMTAQARFYQWASLSGSGLTGHSADYAICQGYQKSDAWRCNVPFNFDGFINPRLKLEKIDDPTPQLVMNAPITRTQDDLLVFRGLPGGRYRWTIEHDIMPGQSASHEGEFELIAIPGPHA